MGKLDLALSHTTLGGQGSSAFVILATKIRQSGIGPEAAGPLPGLAAGWDAPSRICHSAGL